MSANQLARPINILDIHTRITMSDPAADPLRVDGAHIVQRLAPATKVDTMRVACRSSDPQAMSWLNATVHSELVDGALESRRGSDDGGARADLGRREIAPARVGAEQVIDIPGQRSDQAVGVEAVLAIGKPVPDVAVGVPVVV